MTAPRLIRLVPTGETFMGTDLVEPCEVQPLTNEQLAVIMAEFEPASAWFQFARAIEQAHGIGRRLDA